MIHMYEHIIMKPIISYGEYINEKRKNRDGKLERQLSGGEFACLTHTDPRSVPLPTK